MWSITSDSAFSIFAAWAFGSVVSNVSIFIVKPPTLPLQTTFRSEQPTPIRDRGPSQLRFTVFRARDHFEIVGPERGDWKAVVAKQVADRVVGPGISYRDGSGDLFAGKLDLVFTL